MSSRVFIERPPTDQELEKLRLLLSTYQDGSGMLKPSHHWKTTLPGWRDFERACAVTFHGQAIESKFFVDVIFPADDQTGSFYGIDCKMKMSLPMARASNRIYIEVTNAAKEIWNYLVQHGIDELALTQHPERSGQLVVEAVEQMKQVNSGSSARVQIRSELSYYLVLLWNAQLEYQLYQLPLKLSIPEGTRWATRVSTLKTGRKTLALIGTYAGQVLYEWYPQSGGQLKYYPGVERALWVSQPFTLEPLVQLESSDLISKARLYFPELWKRTEAP